MSQDYLRTFHHCFRGYTSQSDYVAAVEARCPATLKSLRGTNAWYDSRNKFIVTFRRQRYQ
jgi:hypothetical protein